MTFEEMKKIVVYTLSCDEDKVTMEEIGRASCRERVYVLV